MNSLILALVLNAPLEVRSFAAAESGFCVTSTLVSGDKHAVLFDAQILESEAKRVVALVKASGRTLDTIYVTHGHPDHYMGLATLHAAFPNARVIAHPDVVKEVAATWQAKHDQWKPMLKDELSDTPVAIAPYDKPSIALDGRTIELLAPMQGDAHVAIAAWVPDASTLITNDLSFAGTHTWLADSKPKEWDAWVASLQRLEAKHAKVVISGHRAPEAQDDPQNLSATIAYIKAFKAAVSKAKSSDEVVAVMSAKYPALKLPIILQISAKAAF